MVLPRGDEAVSVNTFDGSQIQRKQGWLYDPVDNPTGHDEIRSPDLSIIFYNEPKEAPQKVRDFVIGMVENIRKSHEDRIEAVAKTIVKVSDNIKDSQAKSAYTAVFKTLTAWIKTHKDVSLVGKAHEGLTDTILEKRTYASSVRASVNRYGKTEGYSLDYYYLIQPQEPELKQ